jgi:hypothetical protein
MTTFDKAKIATIVAAIVVLTVLAVAVWFMPSNWSMETLKTMAAGSITYLLQAAK